MSGLYSHLEFERLLEAVCEESNDDSFCMLLLQILEDNSAVAVDVYNADLMVKAVIAARIVNAALPESVSVPVFRALFSLHPTERRPSLMFEWIIARVVPKERHLRPLIEAFLALVVSGAYVSDLMRFAEVGRPVQLVGQTQQKVLFQWCCEAAIASDLRSVRRGVSGLAFAIIVKECGVVEHDLFRAIVENLPSSGTTAPPPSPAVSVLSSAAASAASADEEQQRIRRNYEQFTQTPRNTDDVRDDFEYYDD